MTSVFRAPDLVQVQRLVAGAGLPTEDLAEADLSHFFGYGSRERPSGVVGLELTGDEALLRSLVVEAPVRGAGGGRALVAAAEAHARRSGARSVYLLTTTAAAFFERLGYVRVDRDSAPGAIRATREFSTLCPASAVLMVKRLGDTPDSSAAQLDPTIRVG
jgi:amino-acid N-acetyltransferase